MACNLQPSCSILYGVPSCQLPEDIIDVEFTVRTMKGISTYRRDHTTQASSCSLWSAWVKPFPSLIRKIENYLEERRNIENFFHPSVYTPTGQLHPPLPKRRTKPPQKEAGPRVIETTKGKVRGMFPTTQGNKAPIHTGITTCH